MEAPEDFSFQPINGGSTPITGSPPLWGLPQKPMGRHEKEDGGCRNVGSSEKRRNDSDEKEDEKMDVLWEDFNEELLKNLSSRYGSGRLPELEYSESKEAKKDGGGRGGSSGALLSARMAGVVVMMKVLKKILFLHSFRRKLKARTS